MVYFGRIVDLLNTGSEILEDVLKAKGSWHFDGDTYIPDEVVEVPYVWFMR